MPLFKQSLANKVRPKKISALLGQNELVGKNSFILVELQTYITYCIAISLILSGVSQLLFTRYVADRIFEKRYEKILPNLFGCLLITTLFSLFCGFPIVYYLFYNLDLRYKLVFEFTVSILSCIWILNSLLVSLRQFKVVLFSFLMSYSLFGILVLLFVSKKSFFLYMILFYLSQFLLFLILVLSIVKEYYSDQIIDFDFLDPKKNFIYPHS